MLVILLMCERPKPGARLRGSNDEGGLLTCSRRGAFVTARAPGFAHTAAAELFAQLGRHRVQTLPPRADQTEASALLLLDDRRIGWTGAPAEEEQEKNPNAGHPHRRKRGEIKRSPSPSKLHIYHKPSRSLWINSFMQRVEIEKECTFSCLNPSFMQKDADNLCGDSKKYIFILFT